MSLSETRRRRASGRLSGSGAARTERISASASVSVRGRAWRRGRQDIGGAGQPEQHHRAEHPLLEHIDLQLDAVRHRHRGPAGPRDAIAAKQLCELLSGQPAALRRAREIAGYYFLGPVWRRPSISGTAPGALFRHLP